MSNAQYLASLVNSSGNINIPVSNAGINFNNSSAIGASTLTDYETGTWTPSGSGSTTLTISSAYYTKIGRLVYAECDINFSSQSDSTVCQILGLPFTVSSAFGGATLAYYNGANTNPFNSTYLVYSGATYISVKLVDDTGGNRTNAQMSGQRIILSIMYQSTF